MCCLRVQSELPNRPEVRAFKGDNFDEEGFLLKKFFHKSVEVRRRRPDTLRRTPHSRATAPCPPSELLVPRCALRRGQINAIPSVDEVHAFQPRSGGGANDDPVRGCDTAFGSCFDCLRG